MNPYKPILLAAVLLLGKPLFGQEISRIEPPNWWVGMSDPVVQIMLYGPGIGELEAKSSRKGVRVIRSVCPENKNYLFVDLEIGPKTKPGNIPIDLYRQGKPVKTFQYPVFSREPGSSAREGYTPRDVIYLITPDRFANGDPGNDDVAGMLETPNRSDKNGRHGGDLEGIRQHLDYIRQMGFTALWLNPVIENNMPQWSYHGYAITDFYKVDPRMGSNSSYKALCAEAKSKGIKMIMDMIHNHCGLHHWWMKDPPTHDWINYQDKPLLETNHQKTLHPDPYAAPEDLAILEDGWFVQTMPDLNVRQPFLANYLIQNSLWWIEYAGLAGIRMDTYLYPESHFMSDWTKRVMTEYPHFTITGEVWFHQPPFVAYWQRGKQNADGYVSYLPSLFDFPLNDAMIKALTTPDTWGSGWIYLYEMLAQDFQYPNPEQLVVFPDNHDMSRIYAQLGEDIARVKMAITYVLTIRGIPQIYYGTEILMNSPRQRDDGMVRADFPGGWSGDQVNGFTGAGLTTSQKEMMAFVKKLIQWRHDTPAIWQGRTEHFVPQNGVYVYFRYTDTQKIMVILNKNNQPTSLDFRRFASMLEGTQFGTEVLTGEKIDLRQPLVLSSPGPTILQIGK